MKTTLITIVFLLALPVMAEAPKNLIAYWQFDKGTGDVIKDSSGNAHYGKMFQHSKYANWVPGKFGYALNFTPSGEKGKRNNGYAHFPDMPSKFPNGLTITAWIKLNSTCNKKRYHGAAFYEIISNAKTHIGPGFRFTLFYKSLLFRSGDGKKYQNAASNRELTEIPNNTWLNVAVVYTPAKSQAQVYLNGMIVGENKTPFMLTEGLTCWTIGGFHSGNAPLDGAIDEVRIYDYPLSNTEILNDYNKNR